MNPKIQTTLNDILAKFENNEIPEAIAISTFPIPNIPASKWSLLNRTIMFISGTADARGFHQWKEANRYVKKGSKAIIILAPRFKKFEDEDEKVLAGFLAVSVFRVEDTEGEPLDYQKLELPDLPLIEVAKEWGISVKAIPGNYRYYGTYSQKRQEISLATQEESVFFHELSHAGHRIVLGELKAGQDWKQEIVAELCASVLCHIVGKTTKFLGNQYSYIADYAKQANLSAHTACLKVIGDVEKVLNLILKGGNDEEADQNGAELPLPPETIADVARIRR